MSENPESVFNNYTVLKKSLSTVRIICTHASSSFKKCVFFFWCQVSKEKDRFEKLMEYFINDDSNIDFMVDWRVYTYHFNKGKGLPAL